MFKKLFQNSLFSLMVTVLIWPVFSLAQSSSTPVRMDVFVQEGCAHCAAQKAWLDEWLPTVEEVDVIYHHLESADGRAEFEQLTALDGVSKVTPITLVNQVIIEGFSSGRTTGKRIADLVEKARGQPQLTFEEFIKAGGSRATESGGETCLDEGCAIETIDYLIEIPFFGVVDIKGFSLVAMSLLLGFVDGFNPCAMWVLVMFLTILAEVGSRRRMIEMVGLFILAEAIMYYLILNVWMTTWNFVGLDKFVTPVVGTVAVLAGLYFLYLFYKRDTSCKVGDLKTKQKTRQKILDYAQAPMTIAVALGILGLAFSVNIIEFACSVGIPQTFTKILDLNMLNWAGKQWYTFLYILMYMVDDLIVFGIALYSFEKIGLTTHKYTNASHLIGGLIMVTLGILMLLWPEVLVL